MKIEDLREVDDDVIEQVVWRWSWRGEPWTYWAAVVAATVLCVAMAIEALVRL